MIKEELYENCINRRAVLDKIKEVCFSNEQKWIDFRASQGSNGQRDFIIKFIESLPPVISQEPKIGYWTRVEDKTGHLVWECTCGWQQRFHTNYCPDCGARMERKGKNEQT